MSENRENKPKRKRSAYVTPVQKEKLIDYVTCNYGVLYGKEPVRVGEKTKDELWTLIAVELNAMGAIKDVPGWKRCYASLKTSINRKLKNSENEVPKILNSLETKMLNASHSIPTNVLRTVNSNSSTPQKQSQTSTEMKPIGINSTPLQRQQLVNLVDENYDALFGKLSNSANGDLIKKKVWKSIADQLNLIGPNKDIEGWKRCFTGLKKTTKSQLSVIRQNKNRNNNNGEDIGLDAIQSKVFKMHHPGTLDGCETLDELGFNKHTLPLNKNKNSTSENVTGSLELFTSDGNDEEKLLASIDQMNKKSHELDERLAVLSKKLEVNKETSDMNQAGATDVEIDGQLNTNIENNCSQNQGLNVHQHTTEELQRTWLLLINSDNGVDLPDLTNIPDFHDLSEEEQMALLMFGPGLNLTEGNENMDLDVPQEEMHTTDMEEEELVISAETVQADEDGSQTKSTIKDTPVTGGNQNVNGSNVIILDNIRICGPSVIDNQLPTITGSMSEPRNSIIPAAPTIPTQQRPQRRGVEINMHKYVEARRQEVNEFNQECANHPRRNRLSTPLGVMAEMALDEQKKSNVLLNNILSEIRNQRNQM